MAHLIRRIHVHQSCIRRVNYPFSAQRATNIQKFEQFVDFLSIVVHRTVSSSFCQQTFHYLTFFHFPETNSVLKYDSTKQNLPSQYDSDK